MEEFYLSAGNKNSFIIADGRWSGPHGIGRFSTEILARLKYTDVFTDGPAPLSIKNLFWQVPRLKNYQKKYKIFFTPGFNAIFSSVLPFVFTIHDLIHLFAPGKVSLRKKIYYECLLKPAIARAEKILTVSEYSKQTILQWANISADKIITVGSGISAIFTPIGEKYSPGYPYFLHVGNTKPHKNIKRLLQAFMQAKLSSDLRLILTHELPLELQQFIQKNHWGKRILISPRLNENTLAAYYRGARAILFPSLYEGFGLPILEGMASGVPVLTSNITSMPEVAGDAAYLIDPYDVDAITTGIEQITLDEVKRKELITKGLNRIKLFSWEQTAATIQKILMEIAA